MFLGKGLSRPEMTKQDHIRYWVETASDDVGAVDALIASGNYVQGLFFAHLVIEKLAKALWVRDHDSNFPPKSHDVSYLLRDVAVELSQQQKSTIDDIQRYQIEGRYSDYQRRLYKATNRALTEDLWQRVQQLRQFLSSELSSK